MKFERGRKKNQLIWSFILKVIASQYLVKSLFLNKTRKENDSEENTLSQSRRRTREFAPSLRQRERSRGSLTVGPEGPLVRFDRFFPPSPLFCPTGAGLRRSPSTSGSASRASKGGDGTARPRRSFGWLMGRRRWKESPAASSAAEKSYGGEVTLVLRWSPIEVE